MTNDEQELLERHRQVMQAHLTGDISLWLEGEAEEYVVVSGGEVSRPSKAERAARLGPYLERTRFSNYVDLIPPVVRVSDDGSLGWVIVQVQAKGVQQTGTGEEVLEFVSAWIELYEKQGGEWQRVGNVSNFRP